MQMSSAGARSADGEIADSGSAATSVRLVPKAMPRNVRDRHREPAPSTTRSALHLRLSCIPSTGDVNESGPNSAILYLQPL